MSVRFPPDDGARKTQGSTPDSTLSCLLCKAQMQDARIIPGCLHSFCRNCIEKHADGQSSFPCPYSSCNQVVSQPIDSLPANTFFHSLSKLDSEVEDKLIIGLSRGNLTSKLSSVTSSSSSLVAGSRTSSVGSLRQTSPPASVISGGFPHIPGIDTWGPQNPMGYDTNGHNWKQLGSDAWNPMGGGGMDPSLQPQPLLGHQTPVPHGQPQLRGGPHAPLQQLPVSISHQVPVSMMNPLHTSTMGHDPSQNQQMKCGACDENHVANAHCRDCKEDLCESCVTAHQRVKLTREHVIMHYPDTPAPPTRQTFSSHQVPDQDVLRVFHETVEKCRLDNVNLCQEAKEGLLQCETALRKIEAREKAIDNKRDLVARSVNAMVEQLIVGLRKREAFLLDRCARIHNEKRESLKEQQQKIRTATLPLNEIVRELENRQLTDTLAIDYNKKFSITLNRIRRELGTMEPYEDDIINFVPPEPADLGTFPNLGFISSTAFYKKCKAEGDGLKKGVLGRVCRFVVFVNDHLGEPSLSAMEPLNVHVEAPDKNKVWMKIDALVNGQYPVCWRPHIEGDYVVYVRLNNVNIPGSPFLVPIRTGRKYATIGMPIRVFGREGSKAGELSRPWGLCCTKDGLIVVADRSNNRICIFTPGGEIHRMFGVEGRGDGQFNKPAGVEIDSRGRLIVTDKDNHRVQILTVEGKFLMKFGDKGSEPGNFNYPWDVACNSHDQILVSDTRNHRVQLFTPGGEFIKRYGFEGQQWKHFDSPRGVCFAADNQTIVTDFNNHRLLVIGANFENAQYLGSNGSNDGQFQRPNGVTVDDEGNIIVADSRNNRIQVFCANGEFITKFGSKGTGPGEFDTPQGICMTPDGLIVVVDSTNRIQIF